MRYELGFLGCGQMGKAMLSAFLEAGYQPSEIVISAKSSAHQTAQQYGVDFLAPQDVILNAKVLILAVKPQYADALLEEWSSFFNPQQLIISILAGKSLNTLIQYSKHLQIIRAMPNLSCQIKQGITLIYDHQALISDPIIKEQQLQNLYFCQQLFSSMGFTMILAQEQLFHIGTALSSSGLAYLFTMMDALADGAVEGGLGRTQALELISQLFIGAGKLAQQQHPMLLKDQVASPAGVTIRGLRSLEKNQLRSALIEALAESAQRSKEMEA